MKSFSTLLSAFLVLFILCLSNAMSAQSATNAQQAQSNVTSELAKKYPYGDISYIRSNELTKDQKVAIYRSHFKTYDQLPSGQKKAWLDKNPQVKEQMEKESVHLRHQMGYRVPAELKKKYKL